MARLRFTYLVPVLTFYFINLVSSDKLDINDIYNLNIQRVEYSENGMTTIKIYPTSEQPIRQVYDGQNLVWSALLGERAKVITVLKFKYSGEVIVKVDIDFPVSKSQKIYCNRKGNYQEIDRKTCQEKIQSFSTIQKYNPSKIYQPKTEEYPIPQMRKTRQKSKTERSKHLRGKHKRRKYVTPLNEDTETSSETEEILKFRINEGTTSSTDHPTSQSTGQPPDTITHSDGLPVNVHRERKIKKSKKKVSSVSTQVFREELEPEVFELEISSDSDMDVDESTDPKVIQSDASTQTDTQCAIQTKAAETQTDSQQTEDPVVQTGTPIPSALPLKKRPYKPD
ncbi:TpHN family protein [Theileria parva strain Muguga]|uniref:TashAT2 protein, putative n=1 Tax=Theileria parva TaxID=5875 RepID=Q4N867_THEPA|nr:uncharacterized protein TpMuguga_01g00603 [Theileria parva strain Muguga]EAN33841.1 TpHN family protein [Theileria parva strain Muguga]|eukprot:XP_766124.1 hypothetical protein [Theileria parva strain Muguga]